MKALIILATSTLLLTVNDLSAQKNQYDINYSAAYLSKKIPDLAPRLFQAAINGKPVECSVDVTPDKSEIAVFIFPGRNVYLPEEELPTQYVLRKPGSDEPVRAGLLQKRGKSSFAIEGAGLQPGQYVLHISGLQLTERILINWP